MNRSNLLYLCHRIPYPPDRGDRIRTFNILKHLAPRTSISLACLADEPLAGGTNQFLSEMCQRIAIVPLRKKQRWIHAALSVLRGATATEGLFRSARLRRVVTQWSRDTRFDAVLCVCSSMLQYADIPELRNVPLIVDLIDVDSQKWLDYASRANSIRRQLFQLEARRVRRLESSLVGRARAITLVSRDEVELFKSFAPCDDVLSLGNGVDLDYFSPRQGEAEGSLNCVFVGVLNYHANVDGLQWFCRQVWPEVYRRSPRAKFLIVGKQPDATVLQLGTLPGVQVIGEVPDVRPYLQRSALVVAPLQVARGIQNKVLEAMAMGKPVVASHQACEGLQVEPGHHLLRVDQPQEWIRGMLGLLSDSTLRSQLGVRARAFVQQHHCWEQHLRPLDDLLRLVPPAFQAIPAEMSVQ